MTQEPHKARQTIVVYAADRWKHVCPVVRVVGPAQQAGLNLVRGVEWDDGHIHSLPEKVSEADIVVIQRDFPRYVEDYEHILELAHAQGKPVVYELDDFLVDLADKHPNVRYYRQARVAIVQAVVEADAVTCSTPALRDYLKAYNPNVWVLPNYLNDQLWAEALTRQPEADAGDRPILIGYCGGHSHRPDLDMVKPALAQIVHRYGDKVRFKFWGGPPPAEMFDWKNVEWVEPGLVDYGEFARYFGQQTSDIFIAPLIDEQFNQLKSPLKFLEYSALGVAGVYSRVTPYASVVTHEQDGFLATSLEEWASYLARLIDEPELRRQMGLNARQTVREKWLLSQHAGEWAQVYAQVSRPVEGRVSPVTLHIIRQSRTWHQQLDDHITQLEEDKRDLQGDIRGQADELQRREDALRLLRFDLQQKDYIADLLGKRLYAREQSLGAQLAAKENEVQAIVNSPGWKFLEVLGAVRLWFIPRGSRRERLLYLGLQALWVWKQEGFSSFARKAIQEVRHYQKTGAYPEVQPAQPFLFSVADGNLCPEPAISVVTITKDANLGELDEQAVKDWLVAQTCASTEWVVWDKASQTASVAGQPAAAWAAPDVSSLCRGLHGRYLCVASPDLLRQNETYLEANLLALESESLAFTVNVRGDVEEAVRHLWVGRLPGSWQFPLLRQVVRKECVLDDFSIDLSAEIVPPAEASGVAGKLVVHTTRQADPAGSLPFDAQLMRRETRIRDRYILVSPASDVPPHVPIGHVLHPVDTVLPAVQAESTQATVMVVMPFIAVGGAERVALDMMRFLRHELRFILVAVDPLDPALGTMADEFRRITPYVFTAPDYVARPLNFSFLKYLIERFRPAAFYIANGSEWIYDAVSTIKQHYPQLRISNQVYDYSAGWINRYDAHLVAQLDAHIGSTQQICQEYIQRGAQPHQVHFIENGIDTDQYDPDRYSEGDRHEIRQKLEVPPEQKVVSFIARLHPQKRPMDFIELARRFSGRPVTFLMIGDGALAGTVEAEIEKIGLDNLVRRSFYPADDALAISDVLVLPSEYEGMPLVVAQTQAMGKPVVVTDVGNNRQVLDLTQGGVVVSRIGDIAALQDGVERMLQSPPDPYRVRQAIKTRFDLEDMAAKYKRALLGD